MSTTARQIDRYAAAMAPFSRFFSGPIWARLNPDAANTAGVVDRGLRGFAAARTAALERAPA